MTAGTDQAELFDPRAHEALTATAWDADRAGAAIRAIVAEAERAFEHDSLWPPHPLDEADDEPPLEQVACLYLGAAGVIWALHALERGGVVGARARVGRGRGEPAGALSRGARFPRRRSHSVAVVRRGRVLLVAQTLAPSRWLEDELLEAIHANAANPALELAWGSPGTMLAAQVMHERTGAPAWAEAWNASADLLWAAWDGELWRQDLRGRPAHVLGPAHGFVGNVLVLARGDLLDRRTPGRARATCDRRDRGARAPGRRAGAMAASLEPPGRPQMTRTQWCHGAPGIVASLGSLAPDDDQLTELLVGGGELTWQAGPLKKGASLCHGTAGNGYAFLKLFARTEDERWLDRARAFAMHAIEQVERTSAHYGRGRQSLWSGDLGTALYLDSCITATADFPSLDTF